MVKILWNQAKMASLSPASDPWKQYLYYYVLVFLQKLIQRLLVEKYRVQTQSAIVCIIGSQMWS